MQTNSHQAGSMREARQASRSERVKTGSEHTPGQGEAQAYGVRAETNMGVLLLPKVKRHFVGFDDNESMCKNIFNK